MNQATCMIRRAQHFGACCEHQTHTLRVIVVWRRWGWKSDAVLTLRGFHMKRYSRIT
ncbi:hypothetical protein KCP75_21765 [Salmonella enterica subsp. enterica]|nr:hypothetical protein KCP75_21765 [Salmonella enterica subsp. enterica]